MDADQKILIASKKLRATEKEVIADGADAEKRRKHYFARRDWREAQDEKDRLAFKQKSSVSVLADPSQTSTK